MFTVVNVTVLVLRRDTVGHRHFRAPTAVPVAGAVLCAFLASPFSGRDPSDYQIAGVLLVIGVALWAVTVLLNRSSFAGHREPVGAGGGPAGA